MCVLLALRKKLDNQAEFTFLFVGTNIYVFSIKEMHTINQNLFSLTA